MPTTNNNDNKELFVEYLLLEHSKISEAHFKTIETISAFFRNYLLLMTIPLTLIVSAIGLIKGQQGIDSFIKSISIFAGILLIIIAIIGITIFLYIINLRFDAILYARNINGIRKYFYENSSHSISDINKFRVLPQSPFMPAYFEWYYFIPVLFSFGIFNGSYVSFGLYLTNQIDLSPYLIIPIILLTIFHLFLYWRYSKHREYGYLKSNIIGIDIDGVLNKHRIQFCDFYNKNNRQATLKPEDITHIPVHENNNFNITKDDEENIFNNPDYWINMPAEENIKPVLNKLKNIFKLKLFIFTHRPWPIESNLNCKDYTTLLKDWEKSLKEYELFNLMPINVSIISKAYIEIKYFVYKIIDFKKKTLIKRITKIWLKRNGAFYNKLIIEKGNEHVTDFRGHFNNRFIISRKYRIKYFVEDDLEKAIKLSFICDYVFLIQHPYNIPQSQIPKNIIIANSWNDIYRNIRALS